MAMTNAEFVAEILFKLGASIGVVGLVICLSLMASTEIFGTSYHLVTWGLPIATAGIILMGAGALIETWR